ncbi:ATP-binding protein, partial [Alphaproteobacteria bacterium]|nr:ATP-binding protein [Alphaproteobacteria bacterium]
IQIDDDGPGIPPEKRKEAILPFQRLEASRNQKTGGTGLGLSIASDIILSHGGQLDLLNSPKGGLRVHVILPI